NPLIAMRTGISGSPADRLPMVSAGPYRQVECRRKASDFGKGSLQADVAPGIASDAKLLREIERFPHGGDARLGDPGQAQGIETRPGQKGISAAISPDLHPFRGSEAQAAGMEADRVGNHQGVGRHCECARLTEPKACELLRPDSERPAGRIAIAVFT